MVSGLVQKSNHDGKPIYKCDICGLGYLDEITANQCEAHCRTHDSCSLLVTRKAVYKPE